MATLSKKEKRKAQAERRKVRLAEEARVRSEQLDRQWRAMEEARHNAEEEAELAAALEASRIEEDTTCIVCFTHEKSHIAVTCGHQCVCVSCFEKLKKCPYCPVFTTPVNSPVFTAPVISPAFFSIPPTFAIDYYFALRTKLLFWHCVRYCRCSLPLMPIACAMR